MTKANIFVTGGIGFIGSHTVLALLEADYSVTIIDNLDNSFDEAYSRMQKLAGDKKGNMTFIKVRHCSNSWQTLDLLVVNIKENV